MINFRVIIRFAKRIRNRISSINNLIRLKMYGVSYGRNCIIHGKLYINLFPTAELHIGDNLYFSSGWNINALCTNKRGAIYATWNAVVTIGNNVGMSSTVIWAHKSISIGNNVKIGGGTIIMDTDAHSLDYRNRRDNKTDQGVSAPIVIKDDAFIGANCIILKGVTIGQRSIVAAGSVVTYDVPDDCIVGGNPAKVLRRIDYK